MTFAGHFGITLCAQLTRDVSAIAKFLVYLSYKRSPTFPWRLYSPMATGAL